MNTRQKGRRNEKKAKAILEGLGYQVALTANPTKFAVEQDLFGLWDAIAVSALDIRFIQVKSNKPPYGKQKKRYASFVCPASASKEIWVFYDRVKKPTIIQL